MSVALIITLTLAVAVPAKPARAPAASITEAPKLPVPADGWNAPFRLSGYAGDELCAGGAQSPIAVDDSGDLHVVWRRPGSVGIVWRRFDSRAGVWLPESTLFDALTQHWNVSPPIVVADDVGRVSLFAHGWSGDELGMWELRYSTASRSWSAPQCSWPGSVWLAGGGRLVVACRPGTGELHAVWASVRRAGGNVLDVRYSRRVAEAWSAPVSVNTDTMRHADLPAVAVNSAGAATVAWVQATSASPYAKVWARRCVGGTWQVVEKVSPDAWNNVSQFEPSAAALPNGDVGIAWRGRATTGGWRKVAVRRFSGGAWGAVDTFGVPGFDLQQLPPALAVQGDTLHVVWNGTPITATRDVYLWARRLVGETWRPIECLTFAPFSRAGAPGATTAAGGVLHVVWPELDPAIGSSDPWYLARRADRSTDAAVRAVLSPLRQERLRQPRLTPRVLIQNAGTTPLVNVPVACTVFGAGGAVRHVSATNVPALSPGDTSRASFTPWTATGLESLRVRVTARPVGDLDPANDTAGLECTIVPPVRRDGPTYEAGLLYLSSDTTGGPVFRWRDISATGASVPFPTLDDDYVRIPVGFQFRWSGYYGGYTLHDSVYVSTNGIISFHHGIDEFDNSPLPYDPAVYALWDDLHCLSPGRVRYQRVGTAPNETLVVSWQNVRYFNAGDSSLSFQVLLPSTGSEAICQYLKTGTGCAWGDRGIGATIGIDWDYDELEYLYGDEEMTWPFGNLLCDSLAIRFWRTPVADIECAAIDSPPGLMSLRPVRPTVRLVNHHRGERLPCRVRLSINCSPPYLDSLFLPDGIWGDTVVSFASWAAVPGAWVAQCIVRGTSDPRPENDTFAKTVRVQLAGWVELEPMPLAPSGKPPKHGSWLAWDSAASSYIFAAKGNKTGDFYAYSIPGHTWTNLPDWPLGLETKVPYKGAVGVSDRCGNLFATKGNNTLGFWQYSAFDSVWTQLADVPLGRYGKKVKGGTDMFYVAEPDSRYVYLLKGYRSEFYRYNIDTGEWRELAEPPPGVLARYHPGSWLEGDPDWGRLLAHKAKKHELFAYELATGRWNETLPGMPLFNRQTGKSKKSKDGGDAARIGGTVYALKGGNTIDLYALSLASEQWSERETIPSYGATGKRRRVKAGGGMTTDGVNIYALKGNKAQELWRYFPGALDAGISTQDARTAVQGVEREASGVMLFVQNPSRGAATIRWTGPSSLASRPSTLSLYDASGRLVYRRAIGNRHSSFDIALSPGVYLARVTGGANLTRKLVIE
ncbi:MAG: T9SS type A sorting domain-containing protein [bacterium]